MGDLRPDPDPFDSPLETGLRALVVLEAMHPRSCDLTEMTWYDHLVVNTGDVTGIDGGDGPESLHPPLPGRHEGLIVRRNVIEESLLLMHRVHLVDIHHSDEGIRFAAGEVAPSFLDALQAPYMIRLKDRARWLAERFEGLTGEEVADLVDQHVGRWAIQFRGGEGAQP